jgi:hypothetical protein
MPIADLQYWANIAAIVGAVGVAAAFAALLVAWAQLRKTAKATRGQMILAVDQALAPYNDIRDEARSRFWSPPAKDASDPADAEHRRRIKQYMAVWERVETLVVDKSLDLATVQNLYGMRIRFLLRNEVVRSYVIAHPEDWASFRSLARRLARNDAELTKYVEELSPARGTDESRIAKTTGSS